MSDFITLYREEQKTRTETEINEVGIIRKSGITFLIISKRYKDFYFTTLPNTADETFYIKKTDFDKGNTPPEDDHWLQAFEYQMETLKVPLAKDTGLKDYIPTKYEKVIHDCIKLLKQEGSDTKQQVLEKLEELVK